MVNAFVMVKAATGAAETVAEAVRAVTGVTEAHVVAGDYDVIAEVETEEMYEVMETVASNIHELEGTTDTKTYVSMG
jgi:DNA-binding Lrp family transcriptional regulator